MNVECKNKKIQIKNEPYQFIKMVGEGTHAKIWLARSCLYPYHELIIKIAHTVQGVAQERIINEIHYLHEFKSPNTPPIIDEGTWNGYSWFAMPIYKPLTLFYQEDKKVYKIYPADTNMEAYPSHASKVSLRIREQIIFNILYDILPVLVLLADSEIVHADISPGNIMESSEHNLEKKYILTDFGASFSLTNPPVSSFGSLHFTAPERLLDRPHITSDLFSLGVLCFYIVTGFVPFTGKDTDSYYMNVLERDEISPIAYVPEIQFSLQKIIQDMIRFKPENRPAPIDLLKRIQKMKA